LSISDLHYLGNDSMAPIDKRPPACAAELRTRPPTDHPLAPLCQTARRKFVRETKTWVMVSPISVSALAAVSGENRPPRGAGDAWRREGSGPLLNFQDGGERLPAPQKADDPRSILEILGFGVIRRRFLSNQRQKPKLPSQLRQSQAIVPEDRTFISPFTSIQR
jgi:hypothetical protein